MGSYGCTCVVCGLAFTIQRRHKKAYYCSQRCNQKAWRERQKERARMEADRLPMEYWYIYEFIVDNRPDLEMDLRSFFAATKKEVFCEALAIMAKLIGFEVVRDLDVTGPNGG